jgi:ABC-2 type transport system ATP-binding protein
VPDDLAIAARDLVKIYPKDVRAVRGVSLAVPAGTVVGLLGPNGAGKSTIVKILTTLTAATAGTAVVAGHDVARRPDAVRRSIGCVFQKHAVDPAATGRENLLLQGHLYGLRGATLRSRTAELLDRFGLAGSDCADQPAGRPRDRSADQPAGRPRDRSRLTSWSVLTGATCPA